jgi:hypothetical protein
MIDLAKEEAYTLKAARNLPELRRNGKRLDLSTLYRWATSGVTRGRTVKLATVQQAGVRVTTREAIARFFAELSGETVPTVDHLEQHEQSEREWREIESRERKTPRRLSAAGI